jgi:hypothetical protein
VKLSDHFNQDARYTGGGDGKSDGKSDKKEKKSKKDKKVREKNTSLCHVWWVTLYVGTHRIRRRKRVRRTKRCQLDDPAHMWLHKPHRDECVS